MPAARGRASLPAMRALALIVPLVACSHAKVPAAPRALAEAANFRVDPGPMRPCTAGGTCEATLVLTARAGYHVNREYPYKFIADPSSELGIEGVGTFTVDDDLHGTLAITVRPAKAGALALTGTFRLSVCTPDDCAVEAPKIALTISAR